MLITNPMVMISKVLEPFEPYSKCINGIVYTIYHVIEHTIQFCRGESMKGQFPIFAWSC